MGLVRGGVDRKLDRPTGRSPSVRLAAIAVLAAAFLAAAQQAWAGCANTWGNLTSTPATIGGGFESQLGAAAGADTVFTLRGSGTATFYRYRISGDTWATMAAAPAGISDGGALAQAGADTLFALRGNSATFYRYSISGNAWATMTATPGPITVGGALAQAGADTLFALKGSGTTFFRYAIRDDTWDTMAATPTSVNVGAALAQAGADTIFALRGGAGAGTTFFRYTIRGNAWDTMASLPGNVSSGASLLYPGTGDFLYATRGATLGGLFRYSISGDTWAVMTSSTAGFGAGGGLAYPGSGSFLYGIHAGASSVFRRYLLQGTAPDTPTSLAQAKTDSTPVAVGASITDTTSIRFDVRVSDATGTSKLQIELRPAGTAFTSPADVAIDTAIFFQSGFSASSSPETLSIPVAGLAAGGYHWQARVVDTCNDSTGWVRIDGLGASTHFVIGTTETALPVSLVVPAGTTTVTAAPIAASESYVQLNFIGGGTTSGILSSSTNTSGAGSNYGETSTLVNPYDTVFVPIWTNQTSMRLFVGLRSDTATLFAGGLPSGIPNNDAGRQAFGASAILLEFSDSSATLQGDSRTTTNIGSKFAYSLVYYLSETTARNYNALGFDTSSGSTAFRFWYADTYGGIWIQDTTVTVTVSSAPSPWSLRVAVSGITKDLPGGLGGAAGSSPAAADEGMCALSRTGARFERWFGALRAWRDFVMGTLLGRILTAGYYFFFSPGS